MPSMRKLYPTKKVCLLLREVQKKDVLGKVLLDVPFAGYAVEFAKKPIGFALIIIIPALVIISDEIIKIIKELKNKKIE